MGLPRQSTEEALLFNGILFADDSRIDLAVRELTAEFGAIVHESPVLHWHHSSYYADELGGEVRRKLILHDSTVPQERLVEAKLKTNLIEQRLSRAGRRTVNIDPGYLTLSKVVLASTKNYCHRIYLGKGIYAEVTLSFFDGGYQPGRFTYRDYTQRDYIDFFLRGRELLRRGGER